MSVEIDWESGHEDEDCDIYVKTGHCYHVTISKRNVVRAIKRKLKKLQQESEK
jgi:hypothetical protein